MSEVSPLDILGKSFQTSFRGYAPAEVQDFLGQLAGAMERLFRERGELRQQLHRREQELSSFRERERSLQETLVTAQRAAEVTLSEARSEAQRIVDEAQQLADRLLEESQRRGQTIELLIAELRGRRREARADLIRMVELVQGVIHDDQQLERAEPATAQVTVLPRKRAGTSEGQR
jgi:cell division initiation protein